MTSEQQHAVPYPYSGRPPASAPSELAVASILVASGLALVQVAATVLAFPASTAIKESTSSDVFNELEVVLYGLTSLVLIPACIAAYVVTCLWLGKCRKNAELFAPDYKQERDSVWVWLSWWVPIVSLWFPFQVVRDVRRASVQLRADSAALVLWWLCWLVWIIGSRIAGAVLPDDPNAPGAEGAAEGLPIIESINCLAILVGLVLWVRIIREVTRAQTTLVQRDLSQINRW